MLISMRTTLVLDDVLIRQAKRRAAERSTTLSAVVNEALRELLRPTAAVAAPFSMITYGPRTRVDHSPADFAAVLETEDREAIAG
jgi:hypothetical protein